MLDYVAVDYPGAIANGEVIRRRRDVAEEMSEFTSTIHAGIVSLPARGGQEQALVTQSEAVEAAVARRAPATEVALLSHRLTEPVAGHAYLDSRLAEVRTTI